APCRSSPGSGGSPAPSAAISPASTCSQPRAYSLPASSIVTSQQFSRITGSPHRQRDELEAVDVDEPAVGQLQARDHREREEREQLEGRLDRAAEVACGGDDRAAPAHDLVERRV